MSFNQYTESVWRDLGSLVLSQAQLFMYRVNNEAGPLFLNSPHESRITLITMSLCFLTGRRGSVREVANKLSELADQIEKGELDEKTLIG